MHRKNYKEIAAVLAGEFHSSDPNGKASVWKITLSLADVFKQDNIRFDRSRFYEAVFGDSDHLAVRDKFTLESKRSRASEQPRYRPSPHNGWS
jgi:hypothetical protein